MKSKKWFISFGFIAIVSYLIVSLNHKNSNIIKEKKEMKASRRFFAENGSFGLV